MKQVMLEQQSISWINDFVGKKVCQMVLYVPKPFGIIKKVFFFFFLKKTRGKNADW